jgi:hypothetical protein
MRKMQVKKFLRLILLLGVIASITGCATSQTARTTLENRAPVAVESVEVFFDPPKRPFKTVGLVTVQIALIGASDQVIRQEFKKAAAKLGANAVIIESLPAGLFNDQAGRGKAIIWDQ